jgi:uncharacterized RDD family membrane protein YckC
VPHFSDKTVGDKAADKPCDLLTIFNVRFTMTIIDKEKYAGFWLRALALTIDVVILAIPVLACESLLRSANPSTETQDVLIVAELLKLAIWAVYFTTLHTIWGATIGKRAMRIKVIDADGNPPSFPRALLRFFGCFLSAAPILCGFFMAGFTQNKQALHDYIAGTRVIRQSSVNRDKTLHPTAGNVLL